MLSSAFTRKIARVRAARLASRSLHDARAADHNSAETQFPLYRPTSAAVGSKSPRAGPYRHIDLDSLPSQAAVHRLSKSRLTEKATSSIPEFSEAQLQSFYRNVVRTGIEDTVREQQKLFPPPRRRRVSVGERREVLEQLRQRLGLGQAVASLDEPGPSRAVDQVAGNGKNREQEIDYRRLASALSTIAPSFDGQPARMIPTGTVRRSEWLALIDEFADGRNDPRSVEALFGIMTRHGIPPDVEMVEDLAAVYSNRGETEQVVRLISDMQESGLQVSDHAQDLLVQSFLRGPLPPRVHEAITTLTDHEQLGRPFPQSSYNLLLNHLTTSSPTSQPTSHTRALAWDLFAHMRLAAHAYPDRSVYTTMIRACADAATPEPERARDLWIEMTEGSDGVQPTRQEYDAIIRALGTTKQDYLEAFDLLRQMLAKHEDVAIAAMPMEEEGSEGSLHDGWGALGTSEVQAATRAWIPTKETFAALLEGTKRAGDLDRARWVLQELGRLLVSTTKLADRLDLAPNEEIMANMFMTYAAWRPRLDRAAVREGAALTGSKPEAGVVEASEAAETATGDVSDIATVEVGGGEDTGPQTSAEAIREATALFEQILADNARAHSSQCGAEGADGGREEGIALFANVKITTRLVNSYLSVHLSHASSLAAAREVCAETWEAVGSRAAGSNGISGDTSESPFWSGRVAPNGWTYLGVLSRCARGSMSEEDRAVALQWAEETWTAYLEYAARTEPTLPSTAGVAGGAGFGGDQGAGLARRRRWLAGLGPRQIERAWISIIRLFAIHDDTSRSLSLFDDFLHFYPPSLILSTYTPATPRAALGMGGGVRLSDPTRTQEPDVPPHLLFRDIEVLHNRLTRDEEKKAIGKVTWACTSYQRNLEKRRKWRIKGVGVGRLVKALEKRGVVVSQKIVESEESEEGEVEEVGGKEV